MAPAATPKSSSKKASKSPSSAKHHASSGGSNNNTAAGEYLLERLRILLARLQTTTEILQNWPETQGDSGKVHADTAVLLITSIRKIVNGLRSVERHVNGTGPEPPSDISKEALEAFRTSLEDKCPIPLDLLDLLDVGQPFGMNPQCYARGLMKESMRQLAGLERRKRALNMLAKSIEEGMGVRMIKENKGGGEKGEQQQKQDQNEKNSNKESGASVTEDETKQKQKLTIVDGKKESHLSVENSSKRKRDGLDETTEVESESKVQRTT